MKKQKWWQSAVFYQIYPRSFQDTNQDGIGDIQGVIARLDYLRTLGIDAIWLSPVYESPNKDNGYDISNYCKIMDAFGSMDDMEELISLANKRNIRIVMDLVVNHTSDQHPWFIEAQKGNKHYRDYYIWREGSPENYPNQLQSFFGGPAWTYDNHSKQYYFHLFTHNQPDLNWENPKMREDIWKMMRFWLNKGIGGFRLDVIDLIGKKPDSLILGDGPDLHPYLQEMHREVLKDFDIVTIGETGSVTPETAPLYTDPDRKELSMVFQFQHMALDEQKSKSKWALKDLSVPELKAVLSRWQTDIPDQAWNSLFWSNHDQPRIISRWGDTETHFLESGKMFAILLHLMKGTPFIYQGEEIGMTNQKISSINQLADIESINYYKSQLALGIPEKEILESINAKGRDNARTPMQWDSSAFSGFSAVEPWYPVNDNYQTVNVEDNLLDSNSLFYTYQKLIAIRKQNPIVVWGEYKLLTTADCIFAYKRIYNDEVWLICANFSSESNVCTFEDEAIETIISNYSKEYGILSNLTLSPYETFVVKVIQKKFF